MRLKNRELLKRYIMGETLEGLAQQSGISRQRVHQVISRESKQLPDIDIDHVQVSKMRRDINMSYDELRKLSGLSLDVLRNYFGGRVTNQKARRYRTYRKILQALQHTAEAQQKAHRAITDKYNEIQGLTMGIE